MYYYTDQDGARDILVNTFLGGVHPLFLTHKKIAFEEQRKKLQKDLGEFPVVFEVSLPLEMEVEFVMSDGSTGSRGVMSAYSSSLHIGCFVSVPLPLPFVSRILFENSEDLENLYQPSPNLFIPKQIMEVADASFTDNGIEEVNVEGDSLISLAYSREMAANYFALIGTQEWMWSEELQANVDLYLMSSVLSGATFRNKDEFLAQVNQNLSDHVSTITSEESEHSLLVSHLLSLKKDSVIDSSLLQSLGISAVPGYEKIIDIFENRANFVEDKPSSKVLTALILTLKYPHSLKLLMQSLSAYHLDQETSRLSLVYFGLLNGMAAVPGVWKEDFGLLSLISSKVCQSFHIPYTGTSLPQCVYEIKSKKIIPVSKICSYFVSAGSSFFERSDVFDELKKSKKLAKKVKNCKAGHVCIDAELTHEEFMELVKKAEKEFKFSGKKFFEKYVGKEAVFAGMVRENKEFWEGLYEKFSGGDTIT